MRAQWAGLRHRRAQVRSGPDPVRHHPIHVLLRRPLHALRGVAGGVDRRRSGGHQVGEELLLRRGVGLEIGVVVQMVAAQVGEDRDVQLEPGDALLIERVGADLEHEGVPPELAVAPAEAL